MQRIIYIIISSQLVTHKSANEQKQSLWNIKTCLYSISVVTLMPTTMPWQLLPQYNFYTVQLEQSLKGHNIYSWCMQDYKCLAYST